MICHYCSKNGREKDVLWQRTPWAMAHGESQATINGFTRKHPSCKSWSMVNVNHGFLLILLFLGLPTICLGAVHFADSNFPWGMDCLKFEEFFSPFSTSHFDYSFLG